MKERVALFDNAKFMLITLVVVGHFLNHGATEQFGYAQGMFVFIYSFHMPLFMFLSGLFIKDMTHDSQLNLPRVFTFICLGLLLKIMTFAIELAFGHNPSFHLLSDVQVPWFMFVLAGYQVVVWLLRDVNKTLVLVVAILVALAVGYDENVGDFLWMSRFLVFFPFFWAGYMCTPGTVAEITKRRWVIAVSVLMVVGFALFCAFQTEAAYSFRRLFTAHYAYSAIPDIAGCGWQHRLLAYVISAAMCVAALALTPNRHLKGITLWGTRTVEVYFWHSAVIQLFLYFGGQAALATVLPTTWPLVSCAIGIVVSIVLSLKPFTYPLKPIMHCAKKIKPVPAAPEKAE